MNSIGDQDVGKQMGAAHVAIKTFNRQFYSQTRSTFSSSRGSSLQFQCVKEQMHKPQYLLNTVSPFLSNSHPKCSSSSRLALQLVM